MTTGQRMSAGLSPELQRTLEASGVGVYSFDAGTGEFAVDATCRRLFDIEADMELSPAVMASRIHPEDLQRYWASASSAAEVTSSPARQGPRRACRACAST
jgi:hypothetical protein